MPVAVLVSVTRKGAPKYLTHCSSSSQRQAFRARVGVSQSDRPAEPTGGQEMWLSVMPTRPLGDSSATE
jgi:hypothetical protein